MGSGKGRSRRVQAPPRQWLGEQGRAEAQPRRQPLRVNGRPARHGRLEVSVHGLADPGAQINDTEAWHVSLSEEQLRWLYSVIPAALEGIENQREWWRVHRDD